MCHPSCIIFGAKNLAKEEIKGKTVIEVGSYDVNGSLQPLFKSYSPAEYIGADFVKGPGVDVVCNAEKLVKKFGKHRFDIVISTEMMEHVRDWKKVISNLKNVCKPGGTILITTRSKGFAYHAYPHDYWRYEIEDMKEIFSDCEILNLEKDPEASGVFIKARKPADFNEKNLSEYQLYNILADKRVKEIFDKIPVQLMIKQQIRRSTSAVKRAIAKLLGL